jgi:hypothetical protein
MKLFRTVTLSFIYKSLLELALKFLKSVESLQRINLSHITEHNIYLFNFSGMQ